MRFFSIFCIAFTLLAGGCSTPPQSAHVDPALSTLVPPETSMMAGIHVEELLKTPFYQKQFAQRPIPQLDEFARRTGLDVRNEVWEVLFLSDGTRSAILGRGKFANEAEPRLPPGALPEGATRFGYKTYNFTGTDQTAVVFLSPTVAGVGDTDFLKKIVDTRDQTNGPPEVLLQRMQEIPPEAAIWTVFSGAPFHLSEPSSGAKGGKQGNLAVDFSKVISFVQSGSIYVDLRPAGTARATALAQNEADARQFHDALLGMIGIARLMAGNKTFGLLPGAQEGIAGKQAQLLPLVEGIRVTLDGSRVNLYLDQPEPVVEQILQMWTTPRE